MFQSKEQAIMGTLPDGSLEILKLTSSKTGIDENLIRRFGIIFQTLACGKEIDGDKFDKYVLETAKLYVELYDWYFKPASVHKILIHGKNIL